MQQEDVTRFGGALLAHGEPRLDLTAREHARGVGVVLAVDRAEHGLIALEAEAIRELPHPLLLGQPLRVTLGQQREQIDVTQREAQELAGHLLAKGLGVLAGQLPRLRVPTREHGLGAGPAACAPRLLHGAGGRARAAPPALRIGKGEGRHELFDLGGDAVGAPLERLNELIARDAAAPVVIQRHEEVEREAGVKAHVFHRGAELACIENSLSRGVVAPEDGLQAAAVLRGHVERPQKVLIHRDRAGLVQVDRVEESP